PDWVVCSPKLPADRTVIEALDELKLVVPAYRPADYAAVADRVRLHRLGTRARRYLWLQPEDGPRLAEATALAVELAQANPRWRVSVQTHKILDADCLPPAPRRPGHARHPRPPHRPGRSARPPLPHRRARPGRRHPADR